MRECCAWLKLTLGIKRKHAPGVNELVQIMLWLGYLQVILTAQANTEFSTCLSTEYAPFAANTELGKLAQDVLIIKTVLHSKNKRQLGFDGSQS